MSVAVPAAAQVTATQPRIGIVGPDEPRFSEIIKGLQQGLRELGYANNAVHFAEARVPRGNEAAVRDAVRNIVAQSPGAFFVMGSALVRPVRDSAPKAPIVFITPGDPAAAGLVDSLARPGRNMTGMTYEYPELSAKRLELLRELAPRARRVLAFYDPRDASPRQGAAAARAAAEALGLTFIEKPVTAATDVERGLKDLASADAILGIPGGVASAHFSRMIAAAHVRKIPTVFHTRAADTRDAMLTYGANDVEIARQCARLLDKILKGAAAGDLPVERPHELKLTLNAKAAAAAGLRVPQSIALRADEVVE